MAIVRAAEQEAIDVLVVGNVGMSGRKQFLLGNIPNRISHNARCIVVIVNTAGDRTPGEMPIVIGTNGPSVPSEPRLMARGAHIAAVMGKHGLQELFGKPDEEGAIGRRRQAKRLRAALEELGPTYAKLGQVLSTRPGLLPAEYTEELATLQDHVAPMTEEEVVQVMEQELGVPWEDVFDSIDPEPLAAGTIAQVHRATLASGDRVVVKIQRPTARDTIEQDLALLEVFAEKVGRRPTLSEVVDMEAVFEHLSKSLRRELDFRQEAENIERMRGVLDGYDRLAVPGAHRDLSTSRLLLMEEIQGISIKKAPEGPERTEAARQLLDGFFKQILVEGFFHADPHAGNLMWWKGRIYFLDFGMVGTLGPEFREHLVLLLMAMWQEDAGFLTEVILIMTGASDRTDLDASRFEADIGDLLARYRKAALAEMQIGKVLQEMTEIALRHRVPLPASLTLSAKALAQVQLATAELDPKLDPFEVAGKIPGAIDFQEHEDHARPDDDRLPVAEAESAGHARDRGCRTPCRSPPRPKARSALRGVDARNHNSQRWTAAGARTDRGSSRARCRPHSHVDNGGRMGPRGIRCDRKCACRRAAHRLRATTLSFRQFYAEKARLAGMRLRRL